LFWVLVASGASAQDPAVARLDLMAQQAQRMQRMAKSACLVMSGAQSELHAKAAHTAAAEFASGMAQLAKGPGAGKGHDAAAQADLVQIAQVSKGAVTSAQQIAAGDFHSVAVTLLLERAPRIAYQLDQLRKAAWQGQAAGVSGGAVRLLQDQHILIEELLRDLCYARLDLGPATLTAQMRAKMQRFESVNAGLIAGDAALGVEKAPNISIKIALGQVDSKWQSLRALLEAAAEGQQQDVSDVQLASVLGESLTHRMEKLIKMYRKL
jgi:hypothetical protein